MTKKMDIRLDDNTPAVFERAAPIAANMIVSELLPNIEKITPIPQNEDEVIHTRKFATSDGYIEHSDLKKAETEDQPNQLISYFYFPIFYL